jgi:hypothetical protein
MAVKVSPTTGDRILVGVCAAVWLLLVGVSVAAVVALADLGRGFHGGTGKPHNSWVLYTVIVVSALVILAAIPVLLRARRMTEPGVRPTGSAAGRPLRPGYSPARAVAEQARTERMTALRPVLPDADAERIWLRGSLLLLGPMGLALVAVAAATYSMAIGHQGAAWSLYALAGIVTAAMPVIWWLQDRRLHRMLAGTQPS